MKLVNLLKVIGLLVASCASAGALGQAAYPTKPVKVSNPTTRRLWLTGS